MHQIQFRLRLGLRPDPAGGAYSAPPDPLPRFKGLLLRVGEGTGESGGRGGVPSTFCADLYAHVFRFVL